MIIIPALFDPDFKSEVLQSFQAHGITKTRQQLILNGYHPAFAGGIIRFLTKSRSKK